jgi:hypothetical protein
MNMFGDEIKGDNLFAAMKRAEKCGTFYKIRYVGPEWAPITLLGGVNKCSRELGFEFDLKEER